VDPVGVLRGQLVGEVRRLEEFDAAGGAVARRWVVLADLGSRLGVMADHLAGQGVPVDAGSPVTVLRELAERLRACDGDSPPRGPELDELWRDTIAVLSRLTSDSTGTNPPPPADPGGPERRRAFWKRG
jgi:hypothetical protein